MAMMGAAGQQKDSFTPVGEKEKSVVLACDSFHDAESWIAAIEDQLVTLRSPGASHPSLEKKKNLLPPPEVRIKEVEDWVKSSKWQATSVVDGVRILETAGQDRMGKMSPPCMRINVNVNGPVADVFMATINLPPACRTGVIKTIRIVEGIDECTDIIHLSLDSIFVYPSWTGA